MVGRNTRCCTHWTKLFIADMQCGIYTSKPHIVLRELEVTWKDTDLEEPIITSKSLNSIESRKVFWQILSEYEVPIYFIVDRSIFFVTLYQNELNEEQIVVTIRLQNLAYINVKHIGYFNVSVVL